MRTSRLGLLLLALAGAARGTAAAEPPPAWEPGKTWALLIGVLEWEKPGLASFPKPGRQDRVLEKTLRARGVPDTQVTFLEDREATLRGCREALARTAEAAGAGSTLIVYFAGHGLQEDGHTYFANVDADANVPAKTALGVDEIGRTLRDHWKGSRLLLMADACHSGALGSIVSGYEKSDVKAASLASAAASNVSTGSWAFTESVVAALGGDGLPDTDGDGETTFKEAAAHVRREMRFRAGQLSDARRTRSFEPGFVLAKVDPARRPKEVAGGYRTGDYVESEWKGTWWRAQVLGGAEGLVRVHYSGYQASTDESVEPARLRAPRPIDRKAGESLEVEWGGKWWPGVVREVRDDFAFVHYDAYGPEWDEWVTARRLRERAP